MFRFLSTNFHVYLIDLLGMGRSSKPVFKLSTPEDIEIYYVESFEKWREKVGIKNMNLAGYGFGAYISSKYALRYPGVVQKLFLLSPFGVEEDDFLFSIF